MNYIYILYTQAPNIRYLQNKTWKWKSEINVQCCWCTPSLGWNQFAKRFVQEGHLYSVYLVYLVYREVEQKWEPQLKEKMYFSATACLMSKVKNINGLHVKYEQAEWEIKSWSWEALIIHDSPCFYSISTWARGSSALLRTRPLPWQQYKLESEDPTPSIFWTCVCSC